MLYRRLAERLKFKQFWKRKDGAVSVDWVVITAATVALAIGLFSVITEGHFQNAATAINADIEAAYTRD